MKNRTKFKIKLGIFTTFFGVLTGWLIGLFIGGFLVFMSLCGLQGLVASLFVTTLSDYGDYMKKENKK